MFVFEKRSNGTWWHYLDSRKITGFSDNSVVFEEVSQTVVVKEVNGGNFPKEPLPIADVKVRVGVGGALENYTSVEALELRLIALSYPPLVASSGGVVPSLQQVTDVGATTTNPISVISGGKGVALGVNGVEILTNDANVAGIIKTDNLTVEEIFQFPDKGGAGGVIATLGDISGGGATDLGYTASATNGIVTSSTGTDATIPLANGTNAGLSENNLTDAEKTILGNTSGTNTGDDATNTTSNAYADAKVQNSLSASTTVAPSATAVNTALDLKADKTSTKHILLNDNSLGIATVGTTAYQSIFSVLIPANTLADLDTVRTKMLAYKTSGTSATTAFKLYINTINNFATATQIATTDTYTASSTLLAIDREFILRSSALDIMTTTLGVKSDISIGSGGTYASPTFNPAVDNYLFYAFSNSGGDTVQKRSVIIERTRSKTTLS